MYINIFESENNNENKKTFVDCFFIFVNNRFNLYKLNSMKFNFVLFCLNN